MKPEKKIEYKGVIKGVVITLLLFGIFVAGSVYATTVITDDGIWVDGSAVVVEGDYTTWTHVWTNTLPEGIGDWEEFASIIDDANNVVTFMWKDNSANGRFGVYKLSDFTNLVLSGAGGDYIQQPFTEQDSPIYGVASASAGGSSRSIQSYVLIARAGFQEIEVWRGGSQLWTHNVTTEAPGSTVETLEISTTAKYIIVRTKSDKVILYEGS